MFRKLSVTAALSAAIFLTSSLAHGQFGGVQVQVGGYGSGVRIGNFGYGNGYGNSYYNGYGNGFGNQYNGNYGSRYGNFGNGYSNYYGNNGYGYGYVPNAGYVVQSPRYYSFPSRSYPVRRYRYR